MMCAMCNELTNLQSIAVGRVLQVEHAAQGVWQATHLAARDSKQASAHDGSGAIMHTVPFLWFVFGINADCLECCA